MTHEFLPDSAQQVVLFARHTAELLRNPVAHDVLEHVKVHDIILSIQLGRRERERAATGRINLIYVLLHGSARRRIVFIKIKDLQEVHLIHAFIGGIDYETHL